jgi:hypothetical protein
MYFPFLPSVHSKVDRARLFSGGQTNRMTMESPLTLTSDEKWVNQIQIVYESGESEQVHHLLIRYNQLARHVHRLKQKLGLSTTSEPCAIYDYHIDSWADPTLPTSKRYLITNQGDYLSLDEFVREFRSTYEQLAVLERQLPGRSSSCSYRLAWYQTLYSVVDQRSCLFDPTMQEDEDSDSDDDTELDTDELDQLRQETALFTSLC